MELLTVKDVAAAFEGWVHWAGEMAEWAWILIRLVRRLRLFRRGGPGSWDDSYRLDGGAIHRVEPGARATATPTGGDA